MLNDNFPFKAYTTSNESVFVNEVAVLSKQSSLDLDSLAVNNEVSQEAIICSLFSLYLHKYMEDDVISTICITRNKTSLLELAIDEEHIFSSIIKKCHTLLENTKAYFIDDDFIVIKVITDNDQIFQELLTQPQIFIEVKLCGCKPSITLCYNKNILLNGAAQLMIKQLSELISDIKLIWNQRISSISLMTNDIRDNILNQFSIHHKTFDYCYSIYQRFSDQVQSKPYDIALIFADKKITYKQLDHSVDKLAAAMHFAGAKERDRVGVFLHRSDLSIVSILAILKLGCSYIPLDSTYPSKYINNIQKETGFNLALSEPSLIVQLATINCQAINILEIGNVELPSDIPQILPKPEDEFAIFYTSGTTGKPKGAIYNHASPLNKFSWMWTFFNFEKTDVFLQRTSVNFSPSLWEMFGALLIGLKTVIVPDSVVKDPAQLVNTISKEKVTFMGVVPALLRMLFEGDKQFLVELEQLKYISCSGEPLQIDLYKKIKAVLPNIRLFNDYGSTEMNAVGYSEITDESTQSRNFPIGKPISNVYYYILDNDLQLVPPFMAGDLYIGGVSLLNGYIGDISPPFIEDPILHTCTKFFKSGDKARFLVSGEIELVGRNDFIVKVRGMRISLYQTETVIKSCEGVLDACVVSRKKINGENEILAYLYTNESVFKVRDYCMSVLPEYMIPSKLIVYGELPKKTNGKLDRKYLADLAANDEQRKDIAKFIDPSDIRKGLTELVNLSFAGSYCDPDTPLSMFGMTSIDAVSLAADINTIWSLNITVSSIFQFNTINRLTSYIESALKGTTLSLQPQDDLVAEVKYYSRQYNLPSNTFYCDPQRVLVTGANGFLGACVVVSLLNNSNLTVYCVVRANSKTQAKQKMQRSLFQYGISLEDTQCRIKIVCAQVSKDYWGMTKSDYTKLAQLVDGVFHLAADTNHYADYLSLKEANVISTRNILDFCFFEKAKSIIFSSSISVLMKHSDSGYYIDKCETLVSSEDLYNGYGKTKWVCEHLLDNAKQCGLNIGIIRLGELSFHSQTGYYREDDIFHNCLKLIAKINAKPTWENGYINCLAVDKVATALVSIFEKIHSARKKADFIFNLVSPNSIAISTLFSSEIEMTFIDWLSLCQHHIEEHRQDYPPAFGSFFDNGDNALIKEYFKKIDLPMNAYNNVLKEEHLQSLFVPEKTLQSFCKATK